MHLPADFADQLTFTTAHFLSDTQTTFSKAINNLCVQKKQRAVSKKDLNVIDTLAYSPLGNCPQEVVLKNFFFR